MPHVIDLGAGPTNEDCAQLGQSPDFDALNRYGWTFRDEWTVDEN